MPAFERLSQPVTDDLILPLNDPHIRATLTAVHALDPVLLEDPQTRQLVEGGAQFGAAVTRLYGTPDNPKWASGTVEHGVFSTYHNGGNDGHTSVGAYGAGVPRNALRIARAVNEVTGQEIFDPTMRATVFYAAEAHDLAQWCGRTLLPEGQQGSHTGDERLSAEAARGRYLATGGDPNIADDIYGLIMATAFNPQTGTQNVDYAAWHTDSHDPDLTRRVLMQELIAVADLLYPTGPRGALTNIEYTVEAMSLALKDRIIQQRLDERGIDPTTIRGMGRMLIFIGSDPILMEVFGGSLLSNADFLANGLTYSDQVIQRASRHRIDQLFKERPQTSNTLRRFGTALLSGEVSPPQVWQEARTMASY